MLGLPRCFTFGGLRVDVAIARELLRAVEPMAIEAAVEAERRYMEARGEQQRIVELELQQARYEASLAERRYAACDPDNRLIAAQLEKSWEAALRRVETSQTRLDAVRTLGPAAPSPDFAGLADDLTAAWNAPGVTMRTRQRLLRALVTDIIADVDEAVREVVLTIHWRGGQARRAEPIRHQHPVANLAGPALQQTPMQPSPIRNFADPALGSIALRHQPQLLLRRPPPAPFHRGDHLNPLVSHQASPPLAAPPTLAPASRAPARNLHQHGRQSATWGTSSAYSYPAVASLSLCRRLQL